MGTVVSALLGGKGRCVTHLVRRISSDRTASMNAGDARTDSLVTAIQGGVRRGASGGTNHRSVLKVRY